MGALRLGAPRQGFGRTVPVACRCLLSSRDLCTVARSFGSLKIFNSKLGFQLSTSNLQELAEIVPPLLLPLLHNGWSRKRVKLSIYT
ncbi:hypothetical protein L2E82_08170 [Cichorium intybus]|uniref:Uncharacterized protein n=1 Tax=Cichorium intybus TaxID=13427 RepID=A0ACB9G6R3_CICIN|nr:hypothetical protein L2E82_08170 [Cichorium intybus]